MGSEVCLISLEKIGHGQCFGGKTAAVKLKRETEIECEPPQTSSTVPDVPSSTVHDVPYVEPEINLEPRPEPLVTVTRVFSYQELETATNNFSEDLLLGQGGFGKVYRGQIATGQAVAVKKINPAGIQGVEEFTVEVLMLSRLSHPNLVNLVGYCGEGDQRLVVYEFMPLGSLENHLFDLALGVEPLVDCNTRMRIALGIANGLNYLHNQANPPVIHRDLKPSNILLGEGYHPKLSDFGLAKLGPSGNNTHVSTRVMGSFGYCDPDYIMTGHLTVRSDIYSFGVLFLELITGLRALDDTRPTTERLLIDLARSKVKHPRSNNVQKLADPRLKVQFRKSVLGKAVRVALMCVQDNAGTRPNMSDVVTALEYLISEQAGIGSDQRGTSTTRTREAPIKEEESVVGFEAASRSGSSSKETTMLDKDQERERVVVEAKRWGEALRQQKGR